MNRKTVEYKLVDSGEDIAKSYELRRRPKRSRILLHEWQSMVLEHSFRMNPYPDRAEKYSLFLRTKIPMKNVKIWFQNRRAREKSLHEEASQRQGPAVEKHKAFDAIGTHLPGGFQYYGH